MKGNMARRFMRLGRSGETMFEGGEIALKPREHLGRSRTIGSIHTFIFDIVERSTGRMAGEIALRIGDSAEQFYLGHIGYHVNPPFRGHGYAGKACALCVPLMKDFGMSSAVITTDPTNLPSVRTCIKLGCTLESTVSVPDWVRGKLDISTEKHRYIWLFYDGPVPGGDTG